MKLSKALCEDLILCGLKGRSKRSALLAMIHRLTELGRADNESDLKKAVLGREVLQGTGIGCGIAVPHGITKAVGDLTCVMGISPAGIKYSSIDGQPVHLIFLFVNNRTRDVRYLTLLANVCRLFDNDDFRRKVLCAEDPREVMALIRAQEASERRYLQDLPC